MARKVNRKRPLKEIMGELVVASLEAVTRVSLQLTEDDSIEFAVAQTAVFDMDRKEYFVPVYVAKSTGSDRNELFERLSEGSDSRTEGVTHAQ